MLIVDFHSIQPYLYEEKDLTYKKLLELLRRAKSEGTKVVRYVFSFGPLIQVLTTEPEVFEQVFRVRRIRTLAWITLGKQAVKYVDSVIGLFGIHKAPQTLLYFVECVVKKYLEESQQK
jgi:hypothetical protein